MNRVQKLLNRIVLDPHFYKERANIFSNQELLRVIEEYHFCQKKIESLYKEAYYWHGTGFYQYQVRKSKYDKVVYDEQRKIWEEIIEFGGLKPHFDQWIKVDGQYRASISVTKLRTYARMYAELHNTGKDELLFTYGNRKFLIKYFIFYTIVQIRIDKLLKLLSSIFTDDFRKSSGSVWASTISSKLKTKNNSIGDLINVLGHTYSDIPQNMGILIGIKKDAFEPAKIDSEFALSESRSLVPIKVTSFTHIEVPYKYVAKMKNELYRQGLGLPVLPIEFGEIYASEWRAEELMNELEK